jgi:tetratricopeptide (TPR) repeat protein|uniref:Tetratricopeptide repeat protein n=1 Tax=candidate division WOR-3 bacterium TaxID=2052148 RepID=A0A7V3RHY6_UNCW3
MILSVSAITGCLLIFSISGSDTLIDRAVQLYETRHLNSENLLRSYEILTDIVQKEAENLRAHYELSKVCYLMGDAQKNKEDKLKFYNQGIEYGKKAIRIDKNSIWAHFWYMVNLGRSGQLKGVLNSLGIVSEVKKEIEIVLKLNPRHAGAMDAYAMLYYELPRFMGGNLNKSIEYLNKAIEIDSNYTVLYVDMAKVYIKKKEYEKARWFLNKVLDIKNPTFEADYILDDRPEALKLLELIKKEDN